MDDGPLTCARCGVEIARTDGRGRPARYCGEGCKRLTEFELRRLDRRLAGYHFELREELADRTPAAQAWTDNLNRTRAQRIRDLRRWIAEDEARLRELVGAPGDA
jgi:hypothetical protein